MPALTEDDVGKPVVDHDGERVGVVEAVDGETFVVDVKGVAEATVIEAVEGSEGDGALTVPVDRVADVTDDAVRLQD